MTWLRRPLALVLFTFAGLAGGRVSALSAQTATITVSSVDTVATVADVTGSPISHTITLSVSVASCKSNKTCSVYMSANATGSPPAAPSIVFSRTSSTCASGSTAVTLGTTPGTTGTPIYATTDASGIVYLCSTTTTSWSTTPYRAPYRLYFSIVER